jgi:hypothetical protein
MKRPAIGARRCRRNRLLRTETERITKKYRAPDLLNYPAHWVTIPNGLTLGFSAVPSIAEIRGTKRPAPPDRAAAS